MRGVLQLFHKRSKDLFWNCSRTKLICFRTVLGKLLEFSGTFLEQIFDLGENNCRTKNCPI